MGQVEGSGDEERFCRTKVEMSGLRDGMNGRVKKTRVMEKYTNRHAKIFDKFVEYY